MDKLIQQLQGFKAANKILNDKLAAQERELAGLRERLGMAEANSVESLEKYLSTLDKDWWKKTIYFATIAIKMFKETRLLLAPAAPGPEMVSVRRDDLLFAQGFTPSHWSDGRPNEHYNRNQIALGKEPVGEWKAALEEKP